MPSPPGLEPPAPADRAHGQELSTADSDPPGRAAPAPLSWFAAGALVFFNSAAVLVIEIVATRLMAPYVGVTLQTYTAIIGVVLAGISLGSWFGGRFADLLNPRRTLGPLLIVGGVLAIGTLPLTRIAGHLAEGHGSAMILVLALISFFWPAAVLSAINPTVVKLQLERLDRAGTVVGRLSAVGTAGAIFGTVITGFVLLAWLPTSTIVISLGIALILGGVATAARLKVWRGPTFAGSALTLALLLAGLGAAAGSPCQRESAYFCASVVRDPPASPTGRLLVLDGLDHSYVDLADPRHLTFSYTKRMADLLDAFRVSPGPIRALWLGGGGFTLPHYVAATRPGSSSAVLELDANVVNVARQRLALVTGPGLRVRVGDARALLRDERDHDYDVVVGDAFAGRAVPWHLTTRQFISDIRRKLRPGGVYTMNCIDAGPLRFVRAEAATLRNVFRHVALEARFGRQRLGLAENYVFFASDRALALSALAARAAQRHDGETLLGDAATARFAGRAGVLRDDFAPVDQLVTESNGVT
jgi:spermidine synthase